MLKRVDERNQNIDAWVIMRGKKLIAKVQAYSTSMTTRVDVLDYTGDNRIQQGKASGYGYDRLTAALAGLKIDGHVLSDHCGGRLEPPKRGYFLESDKVPKGYTLANGSYYVKESTTRARSEYISPSDNASGKGIWRYYTELDDIKRYYSEDKLEYGYSHCYKDAGLTYLEKLGYTVIKAI